MSVRRGESPAFSCRLLLPSSQLARYDRPLHDQLPNPTPTTRATAACTRSPLGLYDDLSRLFSWPSLPPSFVSPLCFFPSPSFRYLSLSLYVSFPLLPIFTSPLFLTFPVSLYLLVFIPLVG